MKCYAKLNVFLKITGARLDGYHEIKSRFILFKGIFDTLQIVARSGDGVVIGCEIEDNILLKVVEILQNAGFKAVLDEFFVAHQIKLIKNIPAGAGLGGGSSDAAGLLKLLNSELNLKICEDKLIKIAAKIGADVPFFVSGYEAANVSGIGEIIEPFSDEVPDIKLVLSDIFASTPAVYKRFDELKRPLDGLANIMQNLKTSELLASFENSVLNDLLVPCVSLYPKLKIASNEFLSGSGSARFKVATQIN